MTHARPEGRVWARLVEDAQVEVDATLADLPADLRTRAWKIPIAFEHVPSQALQRDGIAPDTLGLFAGSSFPEEDRGELPPQIILYLDNIWDDAQEDRKEYLVQVRRTFLHELGHYLGLDESGLEARGVE